MAKVFPFSSLPTADLVIDAVYEGGTKGNAADDVLGKLIPGAGNQGGFRAVVFQHGRRGLARFHRGVYKHSHLRRELKNPSPSRQGHSRLAQFGGAAALH
jgi:hypothetical protein